MPMAKPYVRAQVAAAGLELAQCEDLSARNEDNVPAPGLVVVATKMLSRDGAAHETATTLRRKSEIRACRSRGNVAQCML